MSFLTVQPDAVIAAAGGLLGIGMAMNAHNTAATVTTTAVVPPAADEVSALIATQFTAHAVLYQEVSAYAATIHDQLVTTLGSNAASYAAAEAANATALV
ncbi:PE family protein [Mycobacterium camsae]|uniref:PE family protein n=1 Tax=Mycobacterium gordonae TaxID=1778 RepID=UPI001980AE90|nr:PE family protein [Mycobacterium gordonae]